MKWEIEMSTTQKKCSKHMINVADSYHYKRTLFGILQIFILTDTKWDFDVICMYWLFDDNKQSQKPSKIIHERATNLWIQKAHILDSDLVVTLVYARIKPQTK